MKKQTFTSAIILLSFMFMGACPHQSFAATATGSLAVSATVVGSCTIAAGATLAFGNVTLNSSNVDATATITPTCSPNMDYTIGLSAGQNGASATTRRMISGANTLSYALYSDSARTVNWELPSAPGTAGSTLTTYRGNGSAQPLTVYGRIPGGQSVAAGTYNDIITITATY